MKLANDLSATSDELKTRLAHGLGRAFYCLRDADQSLSEASGILQTKKGRPSLTSTQMKTVQVGIEKVTAAVHKLVGEELSRHVVWAMPLCEKARASNGYAAMAHDNQEE